MSFSGSSAEFILATSTVCGGPPCHRATPHTTPHKAVDVGLALCPSPLSMDVHAVDVSGGHAGRDQPINASRCESRAH
ncbi:hypothetical protein PG997_007709 [Apiospora hydei]|uniref:Uncharacterized protein n=1 Tax=Apiospora hydei TaxID=1337664 RepID=A0ABR1W8T9_9PEZI